MNVPHAPLAIDGFGSIFYAFDVGFQIDLDVAARIVREATRRRVVRARRPAPVWFDYRPAPVRLVLDGEPIALGGQVTESSIEVLIYDFGAMVLTYRTSLPPTIDALPELASELYDHPGLLRDARDRVSRLVEAIGPAIERPRVHEAVEDYAVFAITEWDAERTPDAIVDAAPSVLARAMEAEMGELAPAQTARLMSGRMSYAPTDLALVDWNSAILFDREPDDVLAVLQHANVELLELRVLDEELDAILDHADETLARLVRRRFWPTFEESRLLSRVASAQTDAAVMFEGVNNAIKVIGNQYLARLYRLAARRLDLPAWQSSVQRKLAATEGLYQKMSDAAAGRRMETLEWVIIILIAASMILPFVTSYGH
ncbi:MAG: hypothetical protein KDA25_11310 [Phycisphaerales bacterium]|nr:hypothetical protein [Phycisphaerales bacterium]